MKHHLFQITGLALLLAVSVNGQTFADDSDAPEPGGAAVPAVPVIAPATIVILNAAGPEDVELPLAVDDAAEPINLEIITAPLRMLLGIGGPPEAVIEDFAVPLLGVMVDAPDGAIDQNEAMIMQFQQQYRPFLVEELGFIRLVCNDLTPEQRPKIKQAAEAGLKEVAKDMVQFQNAPGGLNIQQRKQPDPRSVLRRSIDKALEETLSSEQFARYRHEANERLSRRKLTAILSVVARLDACLFLKTDQRKAIVDALTEHWEAKWEQWLMISAYGDQYYPMVPDEHVVPHLDETQKSVWNQLQKVDFGIWWAGGIQNNQNDGWWGEEQAEGAAQPAAVMQLRIGF